jgi:glyoxylase-like metal-dependent hydrolase (beta-lactamase superfamily II)
MGIVAAFMGLFTPLLRGPPFETNRVLDGGETLDLLGWPVEVIHVPGHTLGSCAFYARGAGVLFAGDAVNGRRGKAEPPIVMEDVLAAADSFRKLTSLAAPILLPGHGSPVRRP